MIGLVGIFRKNKMKNVDLPKLSLLVQIGVRGDIIHTTTVMLR